MKTPPARPQLARPAPAVSKAAPEGGAAADPEGQRHDQQRIDGVHATTLRGDYEELFAGFRKLVDDYVDTRYRRH